MTRPGLLRYSSVNQSKNFRALHFSPDGNRNAAVENTFAMQSNDPAEKTKQWDFFISHASEDKEEIARPLADRLNSTGLMVWYVDYSLKLGSNLRESIDYGLARSRFGIVIVSSHFLEKRWPQEELADLATREVNGQKVIFPVWHKVGFGESIRILAGASGPSCDNHGQRIGLRRPKVVEGSGIGFPLAPHQLAIQLGSC